MELSIKNKSEVNNALYDALGERWYTAYDDPVALLRQESKVKIPWILERMQKNHADLSKVQLLDIGCGGGFLSNRMAEEKVQVSAIDLSVQSLAIAKKYDQTNSVKYQLANAYELPFADQSFDAVTAMDFLEHVDQPTRVIQEVSRVLKPGGQFFFHTFNRNLLAHIVIIKLVELLVKNTPPHMHVIHLFITPEELTEMCQQNLLSVEEIVGLRPKFSTITLRGLLTRTVPQNFSFQLTRSLKLSYLGVAKKHI